jgi:hypothetical protein
MTEYDITKGDKATPGGAAGAGVSDAEHGEGLAGPIQWLANIFGF